MNKIDLIGNDTHQHNELHCSTSERLKNKRPQKLSVPKIPQASQKWRQCKIIGKNVSIRSYSASCGFQNKFYIYGGYQILNGIMSDFYCIDLDDEVQKFDWILLKTKGDHPGPRSKHALIAAKQRIYLICGLKTDMDSSNQIYSFNPLTSQWLKVQPQGVQLPQLDSFGCVYLQQNGQEKIILVCGYDGKKVDFTNSVFEYNITKNKVSVLFEGTEEHKQGFPPRRSGCAATTDGKNIYVFGGKDGQNRMNDLWEFNMTDFTYKQLEKAGDIPPQRNGHTMNYFEGKLYVFGGIHDITWELDDLNIYSLKKNRWTTLQQDSPRKIQRKKVKVAENKQKKINVKSPKRKNYYETSNSFYHQKSSPNSPQRLTKTIYPDEENGSPGRMIQQQKKKAFLQRKANMLKNFQISAEKKIQLVSLQTESQAIKNSLDVIGEPNPHSKVHQDVLTDFGKQSESKFLKPLTNNSNLVVGKKPCARDGHCSVLLKEQLIIFGGDRHQMSFNDIYKLNFDISSKHQPSQ